MVGPLHHAGEVGVVRPDPGAAIDEALERSAQRVRDGKAAPPRLVRGSRAVVWDTITRLRNRARREILGIDDTSYLVAAEVPEAIQQRGPATLRGALRRGVSVRQATSQSGLLVDRELGAITHHVGGQARVVSEIPRKLSILDRTVALLAVDATVLANGLQIIADPVAVSALVAVHDDLWRAGRSPDGEAVDLPPHLAALLPALAGGAPDEVASRRLGISPRTYSRRVAELMSLLGVRNRFQAGLEAAHRGWL